MDMLIKLVPVAGVLALLFAGVLVARVNRQEPVRQKRSM